MSFSSTFKNKRINNINDEDFSINQDNITTKLISLISYKISWIYYLFLKEIFESIKLFLSSTISY